MARPGNNKKRCEKYARSGHREENKRLRQERDGKRRSKFAKRREEGLTYKYEPNPYKEGTTEYNREQRIRANKNKDKRTEFQRWKSVFCKLDNFLASEKRAAKLAAERKGNDGNDN